MRQVDLGWSTLRPVTRVGLVVLLAVPAWAATRQLAVTGVDVPDAGAWRTFGFAFAHLNAGDTLEVAPGTWSRADGGLIDVDCDAGSAPLGTAALPVTVRGVPERGALLDGDGASDTVSIRNCAWWTLDGLTVRTADNMSSNLGTGINVYQGSHMTVRRMLVTGSNRYANVGGLLTYYGDHNTVEENEVYDFITGGVNVYGVGGIARRNYVNNRGRPELPNGYHGGSSGVGLHDPDSIAENNVTEGTSSGVGSFAYGGTSNDLYVGNISLNEGFGVLISVPDHTVSLMTPTVRNEVAIASRSYGAYIRDAVGSRTENSSFLGSVGSGFSADQLGELDGGRPAVTSGVVVDSLSAFHDGGYGFTLYNLSPGHGVNLDTFDVESESAGGTFSMMRTLDPGLGTCVVFIPDTSPLKHQGLDGGDIGANVLFRTENGVETQEPLWDPTTGAFPCGAIVPGINDVPDASCFDVHVRLHVGTFGCTLPAWYLALADAGQGDGGLLADGGLRTDVPHALLSPADQKVNIGDSVVLDASGSLASQGATLVSFDWDEPRGPTGVVLVTGARQSVVLTVPGNYEFRLAVEDSSGQRSQATVATVEVSTAEKLGCGCETSAGSGLLALVLLLDQRRRRRRPTQANIASHIGAAPISRHPQPKP